MAFDWTTHTFSSLITDGVLEIGDGYRAKNDELGGNGPIFLRAGHVSDSGIDFSGVDRFIYPHADRFGSKLSQVGDVVITTKGNSTGRVTFVTPRMPQFVYSPHLSYWRAKPGRMLLPGFLKAWSRSQEFATQLGSLSRSTDMAPYLSLQDQRTLKITIPPMPVQQAISALAIGIDDRIDHNRALAANLEDIARALFKSWFVDFDPVRAKAAGEAPPGLAPDLASLFPDRFVDSELGEIPEGWTYKRLDQHASVSIGRTPPRKEPHWFSEPPCGKRWASIRDMGEAGMFISRTAETLTSEAVERFNIRLAPAGSVLFSFKLTVGRVSIVAEPMATNEAIAQIVPFDDADNGEFLYFAMKNCPDLSGDSTSSIATAVNSKRVKELPIIAAPGSVANAFSDVVGPIVKRVLVCHREEQALTQLRDLLLPRLISGKLRVEDAEAALEAT